MKNPERLVNELTHALLRHRFLYYVLANPVISDYEYDRMERRLREFEKKYPEFLREDSPTQTVGSSRRDDYPLHIQVRAWDMLNAAEQKSVLDTFRPPQD